MRLTDRLAYWLRARLDRRRMDAEIDEELAFHIEAFVADAMRRGMSEAGARREASRHFGGVRRTREDVQDAQGMAFWTALRQDVAYAARSLRRSPGFSAMVVITLGLGIGANAAMFGIVEQLLLRGPAHVERAGELRRVYLNTPDGSAPRRTSQIHQYPLYTALRDQATSFSGVAGYTFSSMRLADGPDAPTAAVSLVTADYWTVLGIRPYLGRFFAADEDRPPRGEDVAVLGYGFWQRQYGGDPGILGGQVRLGGRRFTVVGIAPTGLTGAEWAAVDAWIPMSTRGATVRADWPSQWNSWFVRIIGRLRPGVGEAAAGAEATRILRANYGGTDADVQAAEAFVRPISYNAFGKEPPELGVARLLFGVAAVMVLIVAANVANLLLARGVRRQREIAVRLALGAGRRRLMSMLLSEAAVLAFLGATLGVAIAYAAGQGARATLFPEVAWHAHPTNAGVLLYTLGVAVLAALLIGVVPAARLSVAAPAAGLSGSGKQVGEAGGEGHRRWRTVLQATQVALSVVLLFVAGLFVRSLLHARSVDLGIRPERVLSAAVSFPRATPEETAAAGPFGALLRQRWLAVLEEVRTLPGVHSAAYAIGSPFESVFRVGVGVPGRDSLLPWSSAGPYINAVTPGYFETVGTGLRRGRLFDSTDRAGSAPVAIVNERMARSVWPGEDALGKCVLVGSVQAPCSRVVGVVADARQWRIREDPVMQFYVPVGQEQSIGGGSLLIRPAGNPEAFIPTLRAALVRIVPAAQSVNVQVLAERMDPEVRPWRVGARMFGLFGVLALVVAAIGLFGVVSYLVSQRQHELGVRIAIGARAWDIARLVMGRSLVITAAGAAAGGLVAIGFAPVLQEYLFDHPARDGTVLAAVVACLLVTAVAATAGPCVRACRVDPVMALRAE